MVNSRTRTFVSVLTLIIYGTLALVSVPLHFHQDVPLGGGGAQAFAQHADAQHCGHRAVESHFDCTLCSVVTQFHQALVTATVPLTDPVLREHCTSTQFYAQQQFTCVLSRRGPPSLSL
jgi:hypothetical protein